ncbi:MAG: acyl-CoA dehydratase activase [Gemmatimonadales bacterium]
MRHWAGVDVGSWNTKAAVIDEARQVVGTAVVRSGADLKGASERALREALVAAALDPTRLVQVWATGFGRRSVSFAQGSRTELDCHARGVAAYVAGPLTVIDLGGQDSKVIRVGADGRRLAHRMNRKCAAGTGSFLEEIALRLGTDVSKLDALAGTASEDLELGSFCTVFAGTELLSLIRVGKRPGDLARAAYRSLIKRVIEMDVLQGTIVATGGVFGHHATMVRLLEGQLGRTVIVPPHPQEMGAFGAALAAQESSLIPAGKEASPPAARQDEDDE